MRISIDYARMMAPRIPSGVSEAEWADLAARFTRVRAEVAAAQAGFLQLEAQAAEHARVVAFARERRGQFDDVVVLGIGGSALGAIALRTALVGAASRPRLHVLDNVDPGPIAALLRSLDLSRTTFCVVSKSGTTAETLAQWACARAALDARGLPVARHAVLVTDPERGPLRELARSEAIPAFDVPANVGGRFSVLTPVGTLPAALAGVDTAALLAGAREMRGRCEAPDLAANPAGVFAMLQWRAHQKASQGIHVMMPYVDVLRDIAPWQAQLWGESLGKVDADGEHVGPTPLVARGATDQHSLLQLFMQGPADKTVTFLTTRARPSDLRIPVDALPPEAAWLGNRTLGELLDAEQRATADALAEAGRPSMTITLDACDAAHVGALLLMLMSATLNAGVIYRVNPLDQPGVERGKALARGAMEHPARGQPAEARWIV